MMPVNMAPRERMLCVRMERGTVPLSDVSVRLMCWTNSGRSGVAGVVPGAVQVCTVIQTRQTRRVRRVQALHRARTLGKAVHRASVGRGWYCGRECVAPHGKESRDGC
jgi:hypothetical protein